MEGSRGEVKGGNLRDAKETKQRMRNAEIFRGETSVSLCVSQGKGKLIRSRKLVEGSEREVFLKLGLLNQEQIARSNSELLKKMVLVSTREESISRKGEK